MVMTCCWVSGRAARLQLKKIINTFLTTWSPLWLICGTLFSVLSASYIKRDYFNLSRRSERKETSKYFWIMNRGKLKNDSELKMFNLYLSGRFEALWPLVEFVKRSKLHRNVLVLVLLWGDIGLFTPLHLFNSYSYFLLSRFYTQNMSASQIWCIRFKCPCEKWWGN